MNRKSTTKNNQDVYILPLASIRRVFIVFGIVSFLIVLLGGVFVTVSRMRQVTLSAYQNASAQISQRVNETIKLLTSLAALPEFYEPEVPWEEKVAKLDKINEYYGYMFICYVIRIFRFIRSAKNRPVWQAVNICSAFTRLRPIWLLTVLRQGRMV